MIPALDQLIILPAILPAMTAAFLVLALRHDLKRQRIVSIAVTALLVGLAAVLAAIAFSGEGVRAYQLGAWPAPFGISFVLDRLSATMLLLTSVLALCVINI